MKLGQLIDTIIGNIFGKDFAWFRRVGPIYVFLNLSNYHNYSKINSDELLVF